MRDSGSGGRGSLHSAHKGPTSAHGSRRTNPARAGAWIAVAQEDQNLTSTAMCNFPDHQTLSRSLAFRRTDSSRIARVPRNPRGTPHRNSPERSDSGRDPVFRTAIADVVGANFSLGLIPIRQRCKLYM